jgi:ligand-binding sensor domain-containing protein
VDRWCFSATDDCCRTPAFPRIAGPHGQQTDLSWPIGALLERGDGTLVAGTDTGAFRSTDGGMTWVDHSGGLARYEIVALAQLGESAILAATANDGVVRSDDAGKSWHPLRDRFAGTTARITHLINGPEGQVIAAAFQGVFEFEQDAQAWRLVAPTPSPVRALAADDDGRIWVGTKDDGVLMLRRAQGAWNQLSAGLPGQTVTALMLDRAGHLIASTGRGTYWSLVRGLR